MKKLAILISILSITFSTYAGGGGNNSSKRSHKGKNYKPWEGKERGDDFVKTVETKKGPKAKNEKAWEGKERGDSFSKGKKRVTGPKYKHGRF